MIVLGAVRSQQRRTATAWLVGAAAAVAGCYGGTAHPVSRTDLVRAPGWVVVQDIRLVRQTSDQDCGAAALAMMLQHWAIPAAPGEILRDVQYEPEHGIAAGALRDFARHKGLQAFLIEGQLTDLINEVGLNRPVLVGLVQRYGDKFRSHYEVVAGVNPTLRRVLLLDPARGLREDGFEGFSAEWERAGRPTLVIVPS